MFEFTLFYKLLNTVQPLLTSLISFFSIITVHEFGHFIFCKLFGVKTPTFSIGAGPILFKKKWWDTDFCFSLLPIGGFVEIGGLEEPGQGSQLLANDTSPESFTSKPYWQKMLILSGGIIFNIIFALIIYTGLFTSGMPKNKILDLTVNSVVENGASDRAGLQPGDIIVGINNKLFSEIETGFSPADLGNKINSATEEPITFLVTRKSEKITISIHPSRENPENSTSPLSIQAVLSSNMAYAEMPKTTIKQAFLLAVSTIYTQISDSFATFKRLFEQRTIKGIGGPVMIISQLFKTARTNIKLTLLFTGIINISLATINVLPLGALDGGQIAFTTIEAITRRKLSNTFKIGVNIVSLVFFGLLLAYLTFKDVLALFN
ncbi:site-2 protease family protein [Candidatus Dependentiae bacterium]|nr:site-2 protease family protein [Candidatus Dependentiae bacterium]